MPTTQMRNARLHEQFVQAWREGDVDSMVGLLDEECCSCIRTVEVSGERRTRTVARTRDDHRRYLASPEAFRPHSLRVTNLVTGDWYVFAEYLGELDAEPGRVNRQLAVLYPVTEEGRLVGQLAYAMDRRG